MGNAKNKSEFITELFLYYKPILSKEKQLELLVDWTDSCLKAEEYEMANTLKSLISDVENNVVDNGEDSGIIIIPDNIELVYDKKFGDGKLPMIPPKINEKEGKIREKTVKTSKKRWKWVNIWDETYGFTVLECKFSIKKRSFSFIIINYGVDYS
jgi:hypothetical protein